ncbi:MAG: hypothetical protein KDE51_18425, partial [Anaerolineales bacterium]|nr:hypothetical protein [Anaerolineales bacterium]
MYNRHRPSFTNRRTTSSLPRGTKRKLFAAVVGLLLLVLTIVYTIYLRLELNRLNNPEPATVVRYLAPDRALATPAPRATMPPLPTPNLLWRTPNSTDIKNVGATAVLGDKFFFIVYKEGTSELWWMAANRERATFVFNFREEYSSIELVPFEASQELLVRIGRDTEQVRVWRVDGQTLNVIEEPAVLRSPPLPLGQFDLSGRFLSPGHGHLYATRGDGVVMESLGLLLEDWGAASYLLFGEQFLFSGSQDGLNFELWQTDGRVAGTSQLKEINGTAETLDGRGSHPAHFIQVGEQVYFLARADQTAVPDLWVTDGTSANTYPLTQQLFGQRQLLTTTAGRPLFFPAGEKLFFVAEKQVEDDERASGELWVTDGRPEGTVLLLEQLSTQLDFTYRAAVLEGTLYFLRHGTRELWR